MNAGFFSGARYVMVPFATLPAQFGMRLDLTARVDQASGPEMRKTGMGILADHLRSGVLLGLSTFWLDRLRKVLQRIDPFQALDGLWLLFLVREEVMLESLVDPSCPPVPILPLSYEHLLRAVNAEARQTYVQAMAGGSTNSRLPMIPLSMKYLVRYRNLSN